MTFIETISYTKIQFVDLLSFCCDWKSVIYKNKNNLPTVMDGLGIAIMSTSHGVISNKIAKKLGIGGEVICFVS